MNEQRACVIAQVIRATLFGMLFFGDIPFLARPKSRGG
jgi:hypothetical protein